MSKRDRRLAEKYRAQGKVSATDAARERARRKAEEERQKAVRRSGGTLSDIERRLSMWKIGDPPVDPPDERGAASRQRGRNSRRTAADGTGGENFADRSTAGFLRRYRKSR